MLKKLKEVLFEFDFIWSIPLAFTIFLLYPVLGQYVYGSGFGTYSPEFFHAAIYAGLVVLLFNSFTQMGIYFNFPEVYHYYLGDDFKNLPTWQKAVLFLFIYAFFFFSLIIIWLALV